MDPEKNTTQAKGFFFGNGQHFFGIFDYSFLSKLVNEICMFTGPTHGFGGCLFREKFKVSVPKALYGFVKCNQISQMNIQFPIGAHTKGILDKTNKIVGKTTK